MTEQGKVKGPASYLSFHREGVEKLVSHWKDLVQSQAGKKQMRLVAWMKETHGFGHGHANALIADTLAARNGKD